jgi:hypothetical protein
LKISPRNPGGRPNTPATSGGCVASAGAPETAPLLARLQTALEHNRKLAEDNQRLRRELAHALGDQRATAHRNPTTTPSRATPGRSSITIGPC